MELLIARLDEASETRRDRVVRLLDDFDRRLTPADRERLTTHVLYDEHGMPT